MAPAETTEAILLRRIRFGETSSVLIWLAPEHGKLRTAARGLGRRNSPLSSRPDLFHHAEIQFAISRKSDLHALREVRVIETWDGLREDYARLLAASYLAELCDLLTEPGHAAPSLFDLLRRALGHLSAHQPTRRSIEFFETEACRVLGFGHEDNPLGAIEAHGGRIPSNRRVLAEFFGRVA
jgi:DNA repair protein RecO